MNSFEHFSSTVEFYSDALRFDELIRNINDSEDEDTAKSKIFALLKELNNVSSLRGEGITIESQKHWIDWSYGEADVAASYQEVCGVLEGRFIGYQVVPSKDSETGDTVPVLAAAMDTTVTDPDIGYVQVFVITPIANASIDFIYSRN